MDKCKFCAWRLPIRIKFTDTITLGLVDSQTIGSEEKDKKVWW